MTATVEHPDGRTETLPIFAVRGLATDPDPRVREAAFRAELAAWQANAIPIAAALNAIKGETLALGGRRGWDDPLDAVLEASAVERPAFEAMQAARRASTLAVRQLSELMRDAQVEAYGDGLDADELHPLMWAAKPHYYGSTFYNWPYTFGLLFGLGLYARWRSDAERFRAAYDDMLGSTGMETAAQLAARFGIDVADEAFWHASLDVLRGRIDDFCAAVA